MPSDGGEDRQHTLTRSCGVLRTARSWRAILVVILAAFLPGSAVLADSSGDQLAAYYDRQMAIRGGIAYGWIGSDRPTPMISDVLQVGVSKDAYYALRRDGSLLTW